MATSEVLLINSLPGLNKTLKVFKTDLVSCFTIWFSRRASAIHPSDLLGSTNDLIAFRKSLGLPIHSLSFFSKIFFSFLQWDFPHYIVLLINLFIYMKPTFFVFLKRVYPGLLVFLKSYYQTILENSFWFFYFWLALLCQLRLLGFLMKFK